MNISKIRPIYFSGQIIDSHTHIGTHEGQTLTKEALDVFVRSPLPNNDIVEKIIVSDINVLHNTIDEYNGNLNTLKTLKNDPKYSLLASCSPNIGNVKSIKRLFQENQNSFIGLKFHPSIQQLELSDSRYEPYLNFAEQNNLPCLFHTAVNTDNYGQIVQEIEPFSDPELVYKLAQKHPKTPFVLAHMGAGWNAAHDKTIDILLSSIINNDANLYADISWVDIDSPIKDGHNTKEHILKAIKKLKGIGSKDWNYGDQSFRLVFGTDAPLARFNVAEESQAISNYTNFIEDIKFAIRNDVDLKPEAEQIIQDLFYNNAKKLYFTEKQQNRLTKSFIKGKTGLIVGGITILTGILGYAIHKSNLSKTHQ